MNRAAAGDKLSLQTRVYNNSFVPTQKVRVRFYGMPWTSGNQPAGADGASFFIGEQVLDTIPGFDAGANTLNSMLAGVTFDTTGYDDTHLVFWVTVWQEDASTNFVKDPSGKGFADRPPFYTNPTFIYEAGYEEMVDNPLRIESTDPEQTSFSDNIGVYRAPFYIYEKSAGAAQTAKQVSSARSSGLNETFERLQAIRAVSPVKADVTKPSISRQGIGGLRHPA